MRTVHLSKAFKKDLKAIKSSGYKEQELFDVIDKLRQNIPLEPKYRDHVLIGNWVNYRECHIKPDWLLIYKLEPNVLYLARTGSHAKLFS